MEILSSSSVVDQVRATCGQLNYVDKSSDFAIHYTVNIPHIRFESPTQVSRDILVTSCPRVAIALKPVFSQLILLFSSSLPV